ncbi:receptor-like protein EIX1 [Rosa rugosa]|uniref:receptor-like protein EIX1 n=1 Tax=Rosa rugosa TaxID=74645 RepID=UPI002B4114D8|nr:receptor-like protein EIX1 [Rosa rugosa]
MESFFFAHCLHFWFLATFYLRTIDFCFCSSDGVPRSVRSVCMEEERQALLSFRHDLADPSGRLSSWIGYECCQWKGISCNNLTGHVVKMDLSNAYCSISYEEWELWDEVACRRSLLRGEINPSFLSLKHLDYLDLSCNDFKLPLFIGQLKSLRYLNLSAFSSSEGVIPESIYRELGSLKDLEELDLSINGFEGQVPRLTRNLPNNNFVGGLQELLDGCVGCTNDKLVSVDLSLNRLNCKFPASLGMLHSVQHDKLGNSYIEEKSVVWRIPSSMESVEQYTGLKSIDLGSNRFTGNLPSKISDELLILRLRSNYFSGHIPHGLCLLPILHVLDLGDNNFSGTIPKCFNGMYSLVESFSNVSHYDSYVEQITSMSKGTELIYNTTLFFVNIIDLSSNNLEGKIPEEVSSLVELGTLNLSRNHLSGQIPSKIGNLRWLETLDLSHNQLSGPIPQSLSSLISLSHLNLSYNNLAGRIPSNTQLTTLDDSSIYEANPLLCGVPLATKCLGDSTPAALDGKDNKDEDDNEKLGFYGSIVLGFIIGFWGVCGTLVVKNS